MENYLNILENSRKIINELEQNLQNVTQKILKYKKVSEEINGEYTEIIKHLEGLSKFVGESEESINNAARYGIIFIATILIFFILLKFLGLPIIVYFLLATSIESIGFFIGEKKIKKRYLALRHKNNLKIREEKEKLVLLDEKKRENDKKINVLFAEKYLLEEKIQTEEEISSEILGYFAPLLDNLINKDSLSSSEYLDSAIAHIGKKLN